ncbi:MAG: hypothetical protein EGQ20_10175 [Bacteroides oleiciplenus]|nr:hypothetical protein [Bacteroides oleiciplenus]
MKNEKLKNSLFSDENLMKRVEMSSVRGGNYSDIKYTDSSNGGSKYDILVPSLTEVVKSKESIDKPGFAAFESSIVTE